MSETPIRTGHEEMRSTRAAQDMSETPIRTGHEEMRSTRAAQEEMMTTVRAILSAQAELQESISILASVDQKTQRLCEELKALKAVREELTTLTEATRRELEATQAEVKLQCGVQAAVTQCPLCLGMDQGRQGAGKTGEKCTSAGVEASAILEETASRGYSRKSPQKEFVQDESKG
jgi:hypothetical protein